MNETRLKEIEDCPQGADIRFLIAEIRRLRAGLESLKVGDHCMDCSEFSGRICDCHLSHNACIDEILRGAE